MEEDRRKLFCHYIDSAYLFFCHSNAPLTTNLLAKLNFFKPGGSSWRTSERKS